MSVGTPTIRVDADVAPVSHSKEIREYSDSEPVLEQGVTKSLAHAEKLAAHWNARCKREGQTQWFCPLDASKDRPLFPTKAKCQTYIAKHFKMRVTQAKLEKRPKAEYTAQSVFISPERTISDLVLPEHRHLYDTSRNGVANVQNLGKLAKAASSEGYTAGVLVSMVENAAVPKVKGLDDAELKRCTHQSYFKSKRKLFKTCKAEMARRGIPMNV